MIQRYRAVLLAGLALTVASIPFSVLLYENLRTDLRELLPQNAPAVVHLKELEKRLGFLGQLTLVITTDDLKAAERFVDALGAELQKESKTFVRDVEWRFDSQREYYERFGAFYADYEDLLTIRDRIKARAKWEKEQALTVDLDDTEAPSVDFSEIWDKYKKASGVDQYPDGYYAGENGKTLIMMVYPPSVGTDLASNSRLVDEVERVIARLNPTSFHPSIAVHYSGEVMDVLEEQGALIRDLVVSTLVVLIAVALVIALYYRLKRSLLLTYGPLVMGALWTLAVSYLAIGHLNPNTAFLGAIIVGNGINYGLILLARYLEERRKGMGLETALSKALANSWLATGTAAFGASLSYASLGATGFRGFNEFGFMGGVGMVLCWTATYLAMPAMIVWTEGRKPMVIAGKKAPEPLIFGHIACLVSSAPRAIAAFTTVLTLGSLVLAALFLRDPIEYDFSKLTSRSSAVSGSQYWSSHTNAVLKRYVTPTVVMTDRPEDAERVADQLEKRRTAEDPKGLIDSVRTLQRYLPVDQERKLPLLKEVKEFLTPEVIKSLPKERQKDVREFIGKAELRPVTIDDLPEPLLRSLTEVDGRRGLLVLVFPKLIITERRGQDVLLFVQSVRSAAEQAVPGVRVAGSLLLSGDIISSMTNDGPKASFLSFALVVILVFVVFRSLTHAIWVLAALLFGLSWMGGFVGLFDLKLNFLNFVAFPITIGIGIDYGVNIYQRYRLEGPGTISWVVETTGGAVALCSATTVIGYASLLIADNRALFSFGLLAVAGEITCLSAAVVALPAFLLVLSERVRKDRSARLRAPAP